MKHDGRAFRGYQQPQFLIDQWAAEESCRAARRQVKNVLERHREAGTHPTPHRAPLSAYGSGEHKTGPRQR